MPTDSGTTAHNHSEGQELASRIILPISNISDWPEIGPTASLVVLTGTLRSWALCDVDEILSVLAKGARGATINLQIETDEVAENPAACSA